MVVSKGKGSNMGKLFGTDGIRGIANRDPITKEMGFKVGRAVVQYCKTKKTRRKIVIGRDTRVSGKMLEDGIVSGILSKGGEPLLAGELPTPGIAYITRDMGAGAGIVISASHNPYEYNGFKIFSHEGYKLSEKTESDLEAFILKDSETHSTWESPPGARNMADADRRYITFLKGLFRQKYPFDDMKVVLDCANGATYHVAPVLFQELGASVEPLFINPDGKNINQGCGSQFPRALSEKVHESGSHAGLAFDGDGDRLIAVDENGKVLTGDQILVICAKMLKECGELTKNVVVSTVMSNMGFRLALKGLGIKHITTRVGDRYVMEEMRARTAVLGGEESGHLLFLRHHTTGDGLLSALQLLWAIKISGRSLSHLSHLMTVFPQLLHNVPVKNKPEISSVPQLVQIIQQVEAVLGERGRVLVRYSGTEPVCRIMVEGERRDEIEVYIRQIADVVTECLN